MNAWLTIVLVLAVAAGCAAGGALIAWRFAARAYDRGYRAGVRHAPEAPPTIRAFRLPRRTR